MRRSSSTSASRHGAARSLMVFSGIAVLVIVAVNILMLRRYERRRYETPDTEHVRKLGRAQEMFASGRPIRVLFAGDSTVACGIMPRLLGSDGFNFAWSGFEPSALAILERRILAFPRLPEVVYLGINPVFLSSNEWYNTLYMPIPLVLREAVESFYSDTNSFKPLVIMGGLLSLSNRVLPPARGRGQGHVVGAEAYDIEEDGLFVARPEEQTPATQRDDLRLTFRRSNFRMIEDFKRRLEGRGVRVVWLAMPYSRVSERVYREGLFAGPAFRRHWAEINRTFGRDVVNLAGSVPDDAFRDGAHLTKAGAAEATRRFMDVLARRKAEPG